MEIRPTYPIFLEDVTVNRHILFFGLRVVLIIIGEIVNQDFFRLFYSFQQPTITSDIPVQSNQNKEKFCY